MKTERGLVLASECDDCQPNGENLAGPFDTEAEAEAYLHDNYTTGDYYVVYDDLKDTGYYLYCLDGPQSPPFAD